MTVKQVFLRAAELINGRAAHGVLAEKINGKICYCAEGAIAAACGVPVKSLLEKNDAFSFTAAGKMKRYSMVHGYIDILDRLIYKARIVRRGMLVRSCIALNDRTQHGQREKLLKKFMRMAANGKS